MFKILNYGRWIGLSLCVLYFGGVVAYQAWDTHVVNTMAPAEHLVNAKLGLHETTAPAVGTGNIARGGDS